MGIPTSLGSSKNHCSQIELEDEAAPGDLTSSENAFEQTKIHQS